jgi:predicted nucleotidyltransferase
MVSVDIDALGRYFGSRRHVLFAYLFGSHARGQAGPLSDVDTAIFLDNSVAFDRYFDERLEMTGGVMDVLGVDEVDVAILNQTPIALNYRVVRDGVVLLCRDRNARLHWEAMTRSRYFDFKPFIERYERAVLEQARRGVLTRGCGRDSQSPERHPAVRERAEGDATSRI